MQISIDIYLAVQQDPAIPVVDWPVFHSWSPNDGDFDGMVFLLDQEGLPVSEVRWNRPTDVAADEALELMSWVRSEPWHIDDRGRRVAAVVPLELSRPAVIPAQSSPGSLPAGQ